MQDDHPTGDSVAALVRPEPRRDGDRLRVGFIPLVDCAPLIVAHERGFAAAEGLALDLVRETSWANIRDRVALGHFDAAHMLAPMAIAASLGVGHLKAAIATPFVLNRGGNAVAIATAVHDAMAETGEPLDIADPAASGRALAAVIRRRAAAGAAPLTLAMVYPFSGQNYELRYWLAAAGIHPDRDVRLVVVPPPFMVDALTAGQVDAFCVGAPWPSLAVEAGVGRIVVTKQAIWPAAPEKVVGLRRSFVERAPETTARLVRALDRAAAWCEAPENHAALADLLARPGYLGVAADVIARGLSGRLVTETGGPATPVVDYLTYHRDGTNRPEPADAAWLAAQMLRWGQATDAGAVFAAARQTFRPDIHDAALGRPPGPSRPPPPPFDGLVFDPADPAAHLAGLAIRSTAGPAGGED